MSFSSMVKEELAQVSPTKDCCLAAELAAVIRLAGTIEIRSGGMGLRIDTENAAAARRIYSMIKRRWQVQSQLETKEGQRLGKHTSYMQRVEEPLLARAMLEEAGILFSQEAGDVAEPPAIPTALIRKDCCRRAFVRGAFLAAGSVTNPERGYHLEFVTHDEELARALQVLLLEYDLKAHVMARKETHVVYLKESDHIADVLSLMGAHSALLEMENIRIMKGIRNNVNRAVNCETANLDKTTTASARQVANIELIERLGAFSSLSKPLREVAEARMDNPEASLQELSDLLPGVSRSGINHRLRRLQAISDDLRRQHGLPPEGDSQEGRT